MIRHVVFSALLAGAAVAGHSALAQGLEPGAMAGRAYLPSTHTKGCSGLLCDSDDPRRQAYSAPSPGAAAAAPPPAPCGGILCSLTPYSMDPPLTAAAASARQADITRQQAAPPPAAAEPAKKKRSVRHTKAKTVATRTPDPASK